LGRQPKLLGVAALQLADAALERSVLFLQAPIFVRQELGGRAKQFGVANVLEVHERRLTLAEGVNKSKQLLGAHPRAHVRLAQQRRAHRQTSDALAALDEERQLARRELEARGLLAVPQRRELSLLEPLGEQAQTRTVEVQDLGALAVAAHEQEQVAGQHAALHLFLHDGRQRVEGLAHVTGLRVREYAEAAGEADHERRLHNAAMSSTPSPST